MKRKILKLVNLAVMAALISPAVAQDGQVKDSYDPLVPQLFAVDNENSVFAAINNAENTVDVMRFNGERLERHAVMLVDVVKKRHDEHRIYRPKSVAIYEGFVVFLASHRDSCYLAVLDFDGKLTGKYTFAGAANAFSYSHEAKRLYISGETANGYDFIVVNATDGIDRIDLTAAPALHYRKPKMSEVIADKDPFGVGMMLIALPVVFLGLLLLFLAFKNVGKLLIATQNRRTRKPEVQVVDAVSTGDTHGAAYAAIAIALHLYNEELHDEENAVLTINKVSRAYSPWSSKLHGLNTYFNRR
jgi:Na+-transporting methylmalonyl-CoA/oxaloacetate decarboxylase gamma subunit